MKVCAITATNGRHRLLERSVSFFLSQTYENSIMLIYNNSEVKQQLHPDLEATGRFILVNNHIDYKTGEPYTNVGAIFRDMVTHVPEDVALCAIWDDDDIYLSNHLEQGVKGFLKGREVIGKEIQAYKPAKSYWYHDGIIERTSNTLEPSCFVTPNALRFLGFKEHSVEYHDGWRLCLQAENTLYVDPKGVPTMVYDWSGTTNAHKISGDPDNPDNFKNHKIRSNDHGDNLISRDLSGQLTWLNGVATTEWREKLLKVKHTYTEYFWGKDVLFIYDEDLLQGEHNTIFERCNVRRFRGDISAYCEFDVVVNYKNSLIEAFQALKPNGLLISHGISDKELLSELENNSFIEIMPIDEETYVLRKTNNKEVLNTHAEKQKLVFITAQPDDFNFCWETEIQIVNLKEHGLSHMMKVLVYWEPNTVKQAPGPWWNELANRYPEVEFFFVANDGTELAYRLIYGVYLSVIRPFCLKKYWLKYPEMKDAVVFYMDSDVIFTQKPDLSKIMAAKTCLGSDVGHYLDASYMRDKAKEANLPADHFVDLFSSIINVPKETIINSPAGGAQYVLKGVTYEFWDKVQQDSILIKHNFHLENLRYFVEQGIKRNMSTEDAGIQSWCADMWAVWGAILYFNLGMETPDFMDCLWCSDTKERLAQKPSAFLLHNAGIGSHNRHEAFDKVKYRNGREFAGKLPWDEDLSYVNPELLSSLYVKYIQQAGNMRFSGTIA